MLEEIMEPETAVDPMSGLKWTRRTTGKISKQFEAPGTSISPSTVGKILKQIGFSLKSNVKRISNGGNQRPSPNRKKGTNSLNTLTHGGANRKRGTSLK